MADPATTETMVLDLLADAGDTCLSGEVLSSKLGLAPAEVFRQIDRLRAQGYRIDMVGHRGYRLVSLPDRLTPLEVGPFLTTHDVGRALHHFEETTSTNDEARRLAEEGAFHGETVVAERQTAGRGRRGRSWFSPPGRSIYLSVVLRPDVPPARAPELNLVAAVAVARTLRDAFGLPAGIKWPNDVNARGRKIAGILTELETRGTAIDFVVLGMGVNVNQGSDDFPPELRETATSIRIELGTSVDRPLLTAALLSRFEGLYDAWVREGFAPIRTALEALSVTLGRRVEVHLGEGEAAQILAGEAVAIDETGALVVRDDRGTPHRIVAGDVVHLRPCEP